MNKKTLLLLFVAGGLITGALVLFFRPQKSLSTPGTNQANRIVNVEPSKTLKIYTDPSGFSFNYPDNLSLGNNELKDNNTYAQLQLTTKETGGSLSLKISDSKFKSIDEWVKQNTSTQPPKVVNLGNLKGLEIKVGDRLLLGVLDSGILFNIEVPLGETKDYWMKVYSSVIKDFSFAPPAKDNTALQGSSQGSGSSDDVSFEGEEVVE